MWIDATPYAFKICLIGLGAANNTYSKKDTQLEDKQFQLELLIRAAPEVLTSFALSSIVQQKYK